MSLNFQLEFAFGCWLFFSRGGGGRGGKGGWIFLIFLYKKMALNTFLRQRTD